MAILSIQSHVAFGHVGNSAAIFPLQRLGHSAWAIDTVMFAAHAGYGPPKGPVFSAETVRDVIRGLADLGVLGQCDAVLSGYLGDAAIGDAVLEAVDLVRQANPNAVYCCDPVMGDREPGIYVRPEIPKFMERRAVAAADIITPNAFELQLLTGMPTDTLEHALAACRTVLNAGPGTVLLTSLEHEETPPDMIDMAAVTREGAWIVRTPKFNLDPSPNGAGDLTAAIFLAQQITGHETAEALSRTASAVQAVFAETARAGTRELALIAAQDAIAEPPVRFESSTVSY
ncbi:MAG: pyridoxal kinase PdxY [Alphaproteobacteria bacterium]